MISHKRWAVVVIFRDGTEQIDNDGDCLCEWDDRTPARDILESKREDMRESRKIAKRRGGDSGYEHIRGYRMAHLEVHELPREKEKRERKGNQKSGRKRTAAA